jgi:hypothetical protein
MMNLKKGMVVLLAGTFAFTGLGFTMTARAEGPQARAIREREERRQAEERKAEAAKVQRERSEDKKDHPEVWAAIRALRSARENIQSSRNEKARYKESAIKSIDTALADLESLMARD